MTPLLATKYEEKKTLAPTEARVTRQSEIQMHDLKKICFMTYFDYEDLTDTAA